MKFYGFCEVLFNGLTSGWHIRRVWDKNGNRVPKATSLCGKNVVRDRDAVDEMDAYNLQKHGCVHCQMELGHPH